MNQTINMDMSRRERDTSGVVFPKEKIISVFSFAINCIHFLNHFFLQTSQKSLEVPRSSHSSHRVLCSPMQSDVQQTNYTLLCTNKGENDRNTLSSRRFVFFPNFICHGSIVSM